MTKGEVMIPESNTDFSKLIAKTLRALTKIILSYASVRDSFPTTAPVQRRCYAAYCAQEMIDTPQYMGLAHVFSLPLCSLDS